MQFKLVFLVLFFYFPKLSIAQWVAISPSGQIKTTIWLNTDSELKYKVELKNSEIIKESNLGIQRTDENFQSGLIFSNLETQLISDSYKMLTGKRLINNYSYNQLKLNFIKNSKPFSVIFRVFNDGIAFAYELSGNSNYVVNKEHTSFNLGPNGKTWLQQHQSTKPVYEERIEEYNIGTSSPSATGWSLPLLANPNLNQWLLISETDLDGKYFASHLEQIASNGNYKLSPPDPYDGTPYSSNAVYSGTLKTPWRLIQIGSGLNDLVNSNLSFHLAKPNQIVETNWIKPGMATWNWWSGLISSKFYNLLTPFVDLAQSLEIPYFLVDEKWNQMENGNIVDLINYATPKNVKLWVWYNSAGKHNNYDTSPRDILNESVSRKAEFQRIKNLGIVGVKIDYFESDKQELIKLYLDILKDAAEYQLMVNLHGCTIPKGWQRTYPNLVTMESARGNEALLFDGSFRLDSPKNNVNQIFTRNIIGSTDITPGILKQTYYDEDFSHNSTASHELALVAAIESGVVHLCDHFSKYNELSTTSKYILKKMPTAWDNTILIDGKPNEFAIIARKKGKIWVISGVNGKDELINYNLSSKLDFLEKGTYFLKSIEDGASKIEILNKDLTFTTDSELNMTLKPFGGFLLFFEEKCIENNKVQTKINTNLELKRSKNTILGKGLENPPFKPFKAVKGCDN